MLVPPGTSYVRGFVCLLIDVFECHLYLFCYFVTVWVAAVALFFHRWGKIRMLLPYQPVFKEEEPVIVAACSPSPTLQRMMSTSSQAGMDQMMSERGGGLGGGSQCQQSSPSSAVLVSANKFVSLDPAAIRRNQFKVRFLFFPLFSKIPKKATSSSRSKIFFFHIKLGDADADCIKAKCCLLPSSHIADDVPMQLFPR